MEREGEALGRLLARLQAAAEDRRRSGSYPPGLEVDLMAHTRRTLHHHTQMRVVPTLQGHPEEVAAALPFDLGLISAAWPGS